MGGCAMLEQEEAYGDESIRVGRGILFGLVFGIVLWAGIIGLFLIMFR
jgi:hypothetical protein